VYGLPKAAAELHAATDILPLNRIVPRPIELLEPEVCSYEH
jgi:chemotaxis response regulator CheB